MRLSCTVFELLRVFRRKWPILTHPTCISPLYGMIPFEFRREIWRQKTGVKGLRAANTHTQRHTTTAYTALSIASCGKNLSKTLS